MTQKIEFQVIVNLYSKPNKQGKSRLIKADVITRECYFPFDIDGPYEHYNTRGQVYKDVCRIYHADLGLRTVLGTYEEIRELIHPQVIVQGFRRQNPTTKIKNKTKKK